MKLTELNKQHEEDMVLIARKLESDIDQLNIQIGEEIKNHNLTKMNRDQKITYLNSKIQGFKEKIIQLEVDNLNLKHELHQKQQEIDEIETKLKLSG